MLPHFDLTAQGGGKSVAITPSAALVQTARFLFSGIPPRTGKLWNLLTNIVVRVTFTLTQAASGTSVMNWDVLYNAIAGVRVNCKLMGDVFVQQFITGPIAKHLVEFVGSGYCYRSVARQQVPVTAGATTVDLYLTLPIEQKWCINGRQFALWAGWFEGGFLDVVFGLSTALGTFSTGTVNSAATVRAWVEYNPSRELLIPPIAHWRQYFQAASGGTRVLLQGVGNDGGLQGTIDGARLVASYYLLNVIGMGGATTADNIIRLAMPWRDLEMTDNTDAFFTQYIGLLEAARGVIGGLPAATANPDWGTHPYQMGGEVPNGMNDPDAIVFPLVAPLKLKQKITTLQTVRGNYPIDFGFTTPPSSGTHLVQQLELKEFTMQKKAELIIAAGLNPNKVNLKRKLMYKNTRTPDASKLFCIPESVIPT